MPDKKETFIKFEGTKVHFGFYYHFIKDGDKFLLYIPAYDIFVPSPSKEEANDRARIMVQSFFRYWTGQEGHKKFFLQLHKLGFRAPLHELTLQKLLRGEKIKAKFKPNVKELLPIEFLGSESVSQEGELAFT